MAKNPAIQAQDGACAGRGGCRILRRDAGQSGLHALPRGSSHVRIRRTCPQQGRCKRQKSEGRGGRTPHPWHPTGSGTRVLHGPTQRGNSDARQSCDVRDAISATGPSRRDQLHRSLLTDPLPTRFEVPERASATPKAASAAVCGAEEVGKGQRPRGSRRGVFFFAAWSRSNDKAGPHVEARRDGRWCGIQTQSSLILSVPSAPWSSMPPLVGLARLGATNAARSAGFDDSGAGLAPH